MPKGFQQMLAEAAQTVPSLPVAEALALHGDADTVFVDIRDPRELERDGTIAGAFRCTRGMLEFWIDPASPYHKPVFAEPKRFVFFCAMGWRALLAARTAQEMGLNAANLADGYTAWRQAGGPTETYAIKPAATKP